MSLRSSASRHDVVQKVFGNQQVLDAFVASRQVTVQRLHLRRQEVLNPGSLANYDHGPAIPVAPAQFQQLQRLLRRPSSYDWGLMPNRALLTMEWYSRFALGSARSGSLYASTVIGFVFLAAR